MLHTRSDTRGINGLLRELPLHMFISFSFFPPNPKGGKKEKTFSLCISPRFGETLAKFLRDDLSARNDGEPLTCFRCLTRASLVRT